MTRTSVARAAVALLALLAAGCTAPTGPTPDEVTAWMDSQDDAAPPAGLLGSATGRVDAGVPEPSDPPQVSLGFETAGRLDGVRLSCLGEGSLDFDVSVTTEEAAGGTRTQVVTFADVPCGPDARDEALDATAVVGVGVTGYDADRAGAWHALVLGATGA